MSGALPGIQPANHGRRPDGDVCANNLARAIPGGREVPRSMMVVVESVYGRNGAMYTRLVRKCVGGLEDLEVQISGSSVDEPFGAGLQSAIEECSLVKFGTGGLWWLLSDILVSCAGRPSVRSTSRTH